MIARLSPPAAVVMLTCVAFNRISNKLGIPMLLALSCSVCCLAPIDSFDPLWQLCLAEQICSSALIFIMFYGGFGTNWNEARSIAVKAVLLSSVGTLLTAGLAIALF